MLAGCVGPAPAPVVENTVTKEPPVPRCTEDSAECLPLMDLVDVSGKTHAGAELDGRVVVFFYWAAWCTPCVHAIVRWVS